MHEEFTGVDELVDRRDAHRVPHRWTGADGLDELGPFGGGDRRLHLRRMVGKRRDHDAGRTVEAPLPHREVSRKVTRRPFTTERGGIRADLEEQVAERLTFDL